TCLPSGVNASRLAPNTLASILSTRVFDARSITAMVPSSAAAVQSCLPSGDTSKPSEPRETLITVCTQSCRGCGLDPGGGPACSAPGGGPKLPGRISVSCKILTVPELTLVVYIFFASGVT